MKKCTFTSLSECLSFPKVLRSLVDTLFAKHVQGKDSFNHPIPSGENRNKQFPKYYNIYSLVYFTLGDHKD